MSAIVNGGGSGSGSTGSIGEYTLIHDACSQYYTITARFLRPDGTQISHTGAGYYYVPSGSDVEMSVVKKDGTCSRNLTNTHGQASGVAG